MTVVGNASPIINLDAIGHMDLLQHLYDDILIPLAVHDEVTAASDEPGAKAVQSVEWITRRSLDQQHLASALRGELDAGEAEATAPAVEIEAELLLIDEQAGRARPDVWRWNTWAPLARFWRQSTQAAFPKFVLC